MWRYNQTDELYHYGVLGMKWHVHKVNKALNEYKKNAYSNKAYDKYNKYKKVVNDEIKSLKKNDMKLLYDFNKDKYYAIKNKKDSKKWSTKKKILVGSGIAIGIVGAGIGAKKIKDYLADKKKINLGKSATTYSINRFNDTQPWNRTDIVGKPVHTMSKNNPFYSINSSKDSQPWNRIDIAGRRIVKVSSRRN